MSRSFRLLLAVLGAVALGCGLWFVAGPRRDGERALDVTPVAGELAMGTPAARLEVRPGTEVAEDGTAARHHERRALAGAGTANRELAVVYFDGTPAEGARVVVFRAGAVLSTATTDGGGVAMLYVPDEACEVAAYAGGAPVHREPLDDGNETLRLPHGSVLAGWMTVDGAPPGEEVRLTLDDDYAWYPESFLPDAVWEALGTNRYAEYVAHTTAGGEFRFPGLPEEWRWADLELPAGFHILGDDDVERGPWPFTKTKVSVSRPVDDFHLDCSRALRIRGRLVHGDTGEPIAGGHADLGGSYPDGRGARSISKTLPDDARFEFALQQPLRLGLTTLQVSSAQGAGEREIPLDAARPDARGVWDLGDVPLPPFATLRFLVRDTKGKPIDGAVVRAGEEEHLWERRFSDRTDAEGRTSLEVERHLPDVLIVASHFRPVTVPLGPAPPDPIIVTMVRATELIVDVNRADGPLPSSLKVRVSSMLPLFPVGETWYPPLGSTTFGGGSGITVGRGTHGGSLRLVTDEEGRLGLSAIRSGEPLGIKVTGACGFLAFEETIPALREGETRIVPVDVSGLVRAVRGTVRDPGGAPVTGAAVSVVMDEESTRFVARSGDDGTFAAEGFLPDAITLLVAADGLAPRFVRHRPLPPPGDELVIVLDRGHAIRIVVEDGADRRVDAGELHASVADLRVDVDVEDAGPGVYAVDGLPPGVVDLELSLGGRTFSLHHDTAEPEARFVVPRPARVEVTVERAVDDVVADDDRDAPWVALWPRDGEGKDLRERLVPQTTWGWTASFAAVLPGEYDVVVHHYSEEPGELALFGRPVVVSVSSTGEAVQIGVLGVRYCTVLSQASVLSQA